METPRFVQQNTATKPKKAATGQPRRAVAPSRSVKTSDGRFEIRVDSPQKHVNAPASRAQQLTNFVAKFQAEQARDQQTNISAGLKAVQTPAAATPKTSSKIQSQHSQTIDATIAAIDRARRQFSHAAGMSRTPVDEVRSQKPAAAVSRQEIASTLSNAIASEVTQVAPAAQIRQPFFAKPAAGKNTAQNATQSAAQQATRPEIVFEKTKATAPANKVAEPTASGTATSIGLSSSAAANLSLNLSVNGLANDSKLEGNWSQKPLTNLANLANPNDALRQPVDTEVVELPAALLREISEQHRQFDAAESTPSAPIPQPNFTKQQSKKTDTVAQSIPVEIAAWDVEAFRWPKVSDQILTHAESAMDQLTHYALDILAGDENRIAVSTLRRGSGSTTMASVVARWAAANNQRVLLVDADLAKPNLGQSVGLSQDVSWLNLIRENLLPAEAIIRSKSTGLCVMPLAGVVSPEQWRGHLYNQLGELLEEVRHGFDLILIDVGPVGQLANEVSGMDNILDALMIVDEDPTSNDFHAVKSSLLKAGVRKFVATQNTVGQPSI